MAIKRKGSSKKLYLVISLIIILIAASAAAIYATQLGYVKKATVGVHVGDSFTYSLMGTSILTGLGSVDTPGFSQYNQTDYYTVTITSINGTSVSFNTLWRFLNGTEINDHETIDLSNGQESVTNGFWAIYSSNLNVGDRLRPTGSDGLTVNLTDTKTYADSTRQRNFMTIESESYLATDPTHNTLRYDYTGAWFDKQTGMLETLTWYTEYNNPEMSETIYWNLVSSTVWSV
jgi:hypothetical protein